MAVYTVHQPPPKADQSAPNPERFAFVRDGFSLWAFLLGPLWMLRHRMWLVLLGYVLIVAALQIGLLLINASSVVMLVVSALLALLIGFEAGTLRRFTLGRRGWRNVGIIVGDDLEAAERRFFDSWAKSSANREPSEILSPRPIAPTLRVPGAATEVIGLFPEPGAPR
jgi:hypothetical protein